MRTYAIEGGVQWPSVYIDEAKNLVEISGVSTMRDTNWFYSNVLKWIIAFNTNNETSKVVNIRLSKMNRSTSRWLIEILIQIHRLFQSKIIVNCIGDEKTNNFHTFSKKLETIAGVEVHLIQSAS